MSLRPDDHRSSRSRSKSPGRSRSRSRSDATRAGSTSSAFASDHPGSSHEPRSAAFAQPHQTPRYDTRQPFQQAPGLSSYIAPGGPALGGAPVSAPTEHYHQRVPSPSVGAGSMAQEMEQQGITMGGYADLPPSERPGYVSIQHGRQPSGQYAQPPQPAQWSYSATPVNSSAPPQSPIRNVSAGSYPAQTGFQYAQPEGIKYTARPVTAQAVAQPMVAHSVPGPGDMQMPEASMFAPPPPPKAKKEKAEKYDPHLAYGQDNARVVEVKPGGGGRMDAPPSPGLHPRLSVHTPRPELRAPSPGGLRSGMDRLSVSGNRPDLQNIMPGSFPGGNLPPPSPLLEAYHGTYQSLSPMPSPMMLPRDDLDLDELPPLELRLDRRGSKKEKSHSRHRSSSNASHGRGHSYSNSSSTISLTSSKTREKEREREQREREKQQQSKRVKIYDGEQDAADIVKALSASPIDTAIIIDILPTLTHDQMLDLRAAYKRLCKVHGRGINIAKHLKLKLPTTTHFGKIVYATALGRWESEAYWANYWYQAQTSKRELLIEALFSRQNYEIAAIKDAFRDKRYGDSLARCAEKELRADKFRTAVLLVLEGQRQEEGEVWPVEYRERDVEVLARAVGRREGGESEILKICVGRSDGHLRECLRLYERRYGGNFAREALRKSGNLVGEVVAHILNGVINRPARDAMLLHHALVDLIDHNPSSNPSSTKPSTASDKHDRQHRHELLTSRLVRLHWDRAHLARVKQEYRDKYGVYLEEDVEEATRGDFGEFCAALCEGGGRVVERRVGDTFCF